MSSSETTPPFVSVQQVPGKGKGVIALRDIPQGTRILAESPLLTIRQNCSHHAFRTAVDRQLQAFTPEQKAFFATLHNARPECGDVAGSILSNALPSKLHPPGGQDDYDASIYATACRINHACDANAHYSWSDDADTLMVHVVRDVAEGEEITISYVNVRRCKIWRKVELEVDFGFVCTCRLCSQEPARQLESDARFNRVVQLEKFLNQPLGPESNLPLARLYAAERILQHFTDDGIFEINASWVYYNVFQVAVAYGDLARARVFAMRAAKWRGMICGEDNVAAREFAAWAGDPKGHRLYGRSMVWKTEVGDVPVGMEETAFEQWLWRK